jgi:hypothetical protein
VDELEAVQAHYEQSGVAIALAAGLGDTRLFYADTTSLLDHYQEYAWVSPDSEQFMASLPATDVLPPAPGPVDRVHHADGRRHHGYVP